eukprot:jgi/Tetstr1/461834/TSEL_006913.t1
MATPAKPIPGTPYGKATRHDGITIPLGALCSTSRIVEDVGQALFSGQATNNHIRVHAEQPQGEDAYTGIPYLLKKTLRFPIAAPPYIERICYATFNYRAGYTAANYIYTKETVIAAFREYNPPPSSQPHCDHPCGLC